MLNAETILMPLTPVARVENFWGGFAPSWVTEFVEIVFEVRDFVLCLSSFGVDWIPEWTGILASSSGRTK